MAWQWEPCLAKYSKDLVEMGVNQFQCQCLIQYDKKIVRKDSLTTSHRCVLCTRDLFST